MKHLFSFILGGVVGFFGKNVYLGLVEKKSQLWREESFTASSWPIDFDDDN